MKLIKQYAWSRRDFSFDAECEGCGHEEKNISGYDDRNFYDNVIPDIKCPNCGKSTKDMGNVPDKVETKYPSGLEL